MDAEYDDGKLVTYQQVLAETLQTGQDVWVVTEREHRADFNYGETWNYDRIEDYAKQFGLAQVQMQDVVSAEDFIAEIDTLVDSYYEAIHQMVFTMTTQERLIWYVIMRMEQ